MDCRKSAKTCCAVLGGLALADATPPSTAASEDDAEAFPPLFCAAVLLWVVLLPDAVLLVPDAEAERAGALAIATCWLVRCCAPTRLPSKPALRFGGAAAPVLGLGG